MQFFEKIKKFVNAVRKYFAEITPKKYKSKQGAMGVDLIKYIREADAQVSAIHDIKIKIESDLHKYLIEGGQVRNEKNKGIKFQIPTNNKNITANALVYPNTIQIDIGCSMSAFAEDDKGKKQFASLLNLIWQKLCQYSDHLAKVQEPQDWLLTHYHYGRDGSMEYNGEKFHITTRDAIGDFVRAYSKTMLDGGTIVRIEKIATPKITVGEFLVKEEGKF